MTTTERGIPTTFKGIRFRSRLEARWAAMFDALNWRWEYEPVDLRGYIPDFVLAFPAGPVLVEIKPEFSVYDLEMAAAAKIDRSGWSSRNVNDALILGATWNPATADVWDYPAAGALRQDEWGAALWFTCRSCARVSVFHQDRVWDCTKCGTYDVLNDVPVDLEERWRVAGNAVRWRGATNA